MLCVTVDLFFRLPEDGIVSGATAIGNAIEKGGGDISGGYLMGNIVSSPDASAGTLLAACGVTVAGIPGGLFAALLIYIGSRVCCDKGYAGTSGAVIATFIIFLSGFIGFQGIDFIVGVVLSILLIQGIWHPFSSRLIERIWRYRF